jgi:GNAT superfamily N-acetyltransferase
MDYPRDYRTNKTNKSGLGNQVGGRTVALHSLAVHPKLQGCGLGKLMMKSYMQQINNAGTADRISLLAQGVRILAEFLVSIFEDLITHFALAVPRELLRPIWLQESRHQQCGIWWRWMV